MGSHKLAKRIRLLRNMGHSIYTLCMTPDPFNNRTSAGSSTAMGTRAGDLSPSTRQTKPPYAAGSAVLAKAAGASAIGVLAVGALAIGAVAIGALAIGRLAIKRLSVSRSRIEKLEIAELEVRKLRVAELLVTESYTLPERRDPDAGLLE